MAGLATAGGSACKVSANGGSDGQRERERERDRRRERASERGIDNGAQLGPGDRADVLRLASYGRAPPTAVGARCGRGADG